MLENDLIKSIPELRKTINRKSRILNISHNDMDGVGCNIVIGNAFNNVTPINTNYDDLQGYLEQINLDKYDLVIISDISPEVTPDILDEIDATVVLLDHHETAERFHNPELHRFIDTSKSGTLMCKLFCEALLDIHLTYLEELVFLINDYDLWVHEDKRSKQINMLFYHYWERKFYQRFFEGVVKFTEAEMTFIQRTEHELEEVWNDLEYCVLTSVNVAICDSYRFVNDIAERIMDEDVDMVLVRNTKTQKMSFRSKVVDFSLGMFLQERGLGGGHPKAGAICYKDGEDFGRIMKYLESELYEHVPQVRV